MSDDGRSRWLVAGLLAIGPLESGVPLLRPADWDAQMTRRLGQRLRAAAG